MPPFAPVTRRELIGYLKRLGFEGPYSGGKHQMMLKGELTLRLPNPHRSAIGREYLARILRQARIDRETWEAL